MTRALRPVAALLALPWLVGCHGTDVYLEGTLEVLAPEETLRFDPDGHPNIGGRPLRLPRADEAVRWGVVVVDASPLPPGWRPEHAPDGGLLVAAVDRASPLAAAGLLPYDRVLAVDGAAPGGVDEFLERLRDRDRVELQVTRAGGATLRIRAEASPVPVASLRRFSLPYLFQRMSSAAGSYTSLGPGLFHLRTLRYPARKTSLDEAYELLAGLQRDPALAEAGGPGDEDARSTLRARLREETRPHYVRRFEWGGLLDLVRWQSEVDLETGEERWRLTLLWFLSLGDDLFPAEETP